MTIIKAFVRSFVDSFLRNEVIDLAAQVAYYALLALFPFAMFVLTLIGYIPLRGLDRQILDPLERVVPPEVATLVERTLHEIVDQQRGWLLVSTLLFALWSISGAISGIMTALNRAYGVAETRPIWRVRGRSIVIMIVGVVATIVAATSMLVGPELLRRVSTFFGLRGGFDRLWGALRWPLAFGALTSMAAFTYYFLPNVQHRRRFIMPGSIVAVLGWIMASMGFKLYVAHFASYARTYGALGTVVVLLVWLYIGGLTLIVGGQINAILDRLHRRSVHTATRTDGSVMRAPRLV